MSHLLDTTLKAYGGLERWREVTSISAHRVFDGGLWDLKQVPGVVDEGEITVRVQEEHVEMRPFTAPDRHLTFTPGRVSVESDAGEVVESLDDPVASFAGHGVETPWTHLQLGYFCGHAMWTYLTEPYVFTYPGVEVEEIGPWSEQGRTWQRLRVRFPAGIATMSREQVVYVDDDGLVQRRDYQVDVMGGSPAAHYLSGHREVNGIVVATSRRIYVRGEDGHPLPEPLLVSIELSDVSVA
ncbi:hypothetical protein [Kineococcus rhizosphaerae]|uniref:Uncharacterized protein n=1 Tax=Kineococcus rhizosphaerae TaxID=559628 RepID=A0A2T0R2U0_9ACTN|nr:hypothetical protein [Kineococcus rhizosphaerae]PRY14104.1 hypothetical protein CLV37_107223 [Kineococcus rhizosphaerae]